MELVEGRTIRELLVGAEAPPVEQALIIVSGVLEALAYSHQHGIVHRDIKPANVIITNAGAVKVMDFGIARALHGASSTMTQTGMVMGTPQYLSPEQALGKAVDHRSDLYATGCLLYELLALRPPFVGETPLSVVYQHVQDEPRVPSQISDRVPPELDGLVLRALAKNPDDRFQSAEEMRGVSQYALRMLSERGPWTGTWDTGYVDHFAPGTPPGGMAATTTLPQPDSGHTAALGPPLLMGPPSGGSSAETGYYDAYDDRPVSATGGRNTVLVVVAALVAIGLGVFVAVNAAHHGGHRQPADSVTPSTSRSSQPAIAAHRLHQRGRRHLRELHLGSVDLDAHHAVDLGPAQQHAHHPAAHHAPGEHRSADRAAARPAPAEAAPGETNSAGGSHSAAPPGRSDGSDGGGSGNGSLSGTPDRRTQPLTRHSVNASSTGLVLPRPPHHQAPPRPGRAGPRGGRAARSASAASRSR